MFKSKLEIKKFIYKRKKNDVNCLKQDKKKL